MNPAALKANLGDLISGGAIIINTDAFTPANLKKAGYATNPLEDGSLKNYEVHKLPITTLNRHALEHIEGLTTNDIDRCKNFFALGLTFWIYDRPLKTSLDFIDAKFSKKYPKIAQANKEALQAGYSVGHNTEAFQTRFHIKPAHLKPGLYRKVTGNEAVAMGLITAAQKANKPLFYGSYPITPASDILHYLAAAKNFDVRTFQAEDEIAAMGSTIGAAFGGAFAVTGTSGPGIALKSEAINLALMLELPVVIVNVQRGGPAPVCPPKLSNLTCCKPCTAATAKAPSPFWPRYPSNCFEMAIEAFRLAVRAMTPVFLLSDGYLGNSSEPWLIPHPDDIPPIEVTHPTGPNVDNGLFLPYKRDPETMGRPWAIPGTPGLEHRMGGLAKQPETGNVSYNPLENQKMVCERAEKVKRLVDIIPDQIIRGPEQGDLLVVSWGSTFGAVRSAILRLQKQGKAVTHAHVRYLNPFPRNLGQILSRFDRILVPEMNMGQLVILLRGTYGTHNFLPYSKVQGRPFTINEIEDKLTSYWLKPRRT
jgi:2-oxoglutarate ferredoxin oxidoreductase subunit alpha